ncbi:hypothetical protein ACTHAM_001322 [Cellulomonas soli]|uniref:hypothetical protein n=1 Tax=Cellulomonas soli TaxID=931535 RepID=UPI001D8F5C0D|nr:hypothetical protein [Cellulomonadaceae bacterium]
MNAEELATLDRGHWHNDARLHGYREDIPPTEYQTTLYATYGSNQHPAAIP